MGFTDAERAEIAEGFRNAFGLMSDEDEAKLIQRELQKLSDLDVIDYFLPTDPLGEGWVIGYQGAILKFDTAQVRAYLLGVAAVTRRVATKAGLL